MSQSTLTIVGQDQNGNPITGFAVSVASPNGNTTSVTAPTSYSVNSNWLYSIHAQNTGSCSFAYWAGVNSASNPLEPGDQRA